MKKIKSLIAVVFLLNVCIAISPFKSDSKPLKATEVMLPIGKTGQQISLADFSKLSASEYEKLAHVKLDFLDRLAYRKAMRKLRHGIAADGTITNKKIVSMVKPNSITDDFNLGGFALGLFLGLIGVLIAYLLKGDNKEVRIKWAWYGLIVLVGLVLIGAIL